MAKSDFICGKCKKVKGTTAFGNPTEKYKCAKCGSLCRGCVTVQTRFFGATKRYCNNCDGEVLLYEFNSKRSRWEKA